MKNSTKTRTQRKKKPVVTAPEIKYVVFKEGLSISVFGKVHVFDDKLADWLPPFKVKQVKLNDEWLLSQVFINNDAHYKLYLEKAHDIKALTLDLVEKYKLEKYFEIKH